MKTTTVLAALTAAIANVGYAAPQAAPGPETFQVKNFSFKHAPFTDDAVAYFELALGDGTSPTRTIRCYDGVIAYRGDNTMLAPVETTSCEDGTLFSLTRTGPNQRWKLKLGFTDVRAKYVFAKEDVQTYTGYTIGQQKQFQTLVVPGNSFKAVAY